jgi:hypothetical protein
MHLGDAGLYQVLGCDQRKCSLHFLQMSWSASSCTPSHDECMCIVFYELHTVCPAFLYSSLLLAMKRAYWVLYGYKIPHQTNYTKVFLYSLRVLHNTLFCFSSSLPHLLHLHSISFPSLVLRLLIQNILEICTFCFFFLTCFYEFKAQESFLTMEEHTDEGL